ncbi:hypothetical protein DRN58_04860 [Thermococci archaeon]|nr:MAG: hypothetical protein DRN50_04695 [Thermococci archaeon]RLF99621.1 MAG: hypothetical protein DRN58_04860 [Thermococci archaeon]
MAKIAFDIDGVLARGLDINKLNSGRDTEIYRNLMFDYRCLSLIEDLRRNNEIYIITARCSRYRDVTISWLSKHNLLYDKIFLNYYNDWRMGPRYKAEVIRWENIDVLIDDSPEVIDYVSRYTNCKTILFNGWKRVEKEFEHFFINAGNDNIKIGKRF